MPITRVNQMQHPGLLHLYYILYGSSPRSSGKWRALIGQPAGYDIAGEILLHLFMVQDMNSHPIFGLDSAGPKTTQVYLDPYTLLENI